MTVEEARKRLQELAGQITEVLSVMNDVAQEHGIPYIEFMDTCINFGVKLGHRYEDIDESFDWETRFPDFKRKLEFPTSCRWATVR